MNSRFFGKREEALKFKRLAKEIHIKQLEELKNHKDSYEASEKYKDVIDFVMKDKKCDELKEVKVYSVTHEGISSISDFVKKELENELKKENGTINKPLILSLASHINSFVSAAGFYSTISKEIFIVRNLYDKYFYRSDEKRKKGQRSYSKLYRPSCFSLDKWLDMKNKATLAHELLHYEMGLTNYSKNEMLHEEYAYGHMVSYCKSLGLKKEDIVEGFLISYGNICAIKRDPTLQFKERKKDLKKKAIEIAESLYESYHNQVAGPKEDPNFELNMEKQRKEALRKRAKMIEL